MENASKALIMAGTILISIMVVSLGVYIINMFGEYTAGQEQERVNRQIAEFNAQFLKYEGRKDITAQDIVTVANLAKENNEFYELANTVPSENNYYIQVSVIGIDKTYNYFEKHESVSVDNTEYAKKYMEEKNEFLTKNSVNTSNEIQYYECTEVKVSSATHRVYKIKFKPYTP